MILIADGGSTKIDWAVLDTMSRETVDRFSTPGFNPSLASAGDIEAFMTAELRPQLADLTRGVRETYYYGAGCVGEAADEVRTVLERVVGCRLVKVESDLYGAACSLLGRQRGIVAILGTGSNSGLWDGHGFAEHIPSLGYILGDEGSGAYLGRCLLSDVLKHRLPQDICARFLEQYRLNEADIVRRVYGQPRPNAFMASFTPFLKVNIEEPAIEALVRNAMDAFVQRNILGYKDCHNIPIYFTGSVATVFADILSDAVAAAGCRMGDIVERPLQGLINYHLA